jgi:hypothetical protein
VTGTYELKKRGLIYFKIPSGFGDLVILGFGFSFKYFDGKIFQNI